MSRVVTAVNDLKTWCLDNGDYGKQLLKEWTGQCIDDNKQYAPDEVSRGTAKRFNWQCSKDTSHIWEATVNNRTSHKRGCPYCSGKRITDENSLKTWCSNNGDYGKQLLKEWTGQCIDDNRQYNINEVAKASRKKFKWQCSKNPSHIWYTRIVHRTISKSSCPYCSRLTDKNSLKTWCMNNGTFGKQIFNEWTGIRVGDNKKCSIDEVAMASNKKFKWQCLKNTSHIWVATVNSRTGNKTGCPYCNSYGTSYPEQVIYHSIKQVYPKTINRVTCLGYEFDIAIPEIDTYIEYSGWNWHKDRIDRDKEKRDLCEKYKVNFIQIYAHNGNVRSPDIFESNFILYKIDSAKHDEQLKNIISMILKQFNHSIDEIDFHKACADALGSIRSNVQDGVNDLKTWCLNNGTFGQQLLKEWTGQCENSNRTYLPDEISYGSNKKFRWQCSKDTSHIWDTTVDNRTSNKSGCPYCLGKRLTDKNSLKTWCMNNGTFGQQLLKEWTGQCLDDNKQYTPDEVAKTSNKKFKWRCSKDTSHIWKITVNNRTRYKTGCPYCSGRKVTDKNSLKTWCLNNGSWGQQLLKEWTGQCIDDNKQYTPDEVAKASSKKFKWQCSKELSHIWDATLDSRTGHKAGCPYCSGAKITDKNSLKTWCLNNGDFGQQLLKEWTGQCIDDNKQYILGEVTKGSTKKFRWKCLKDSSHIWNATVVTRTSNKTGCPYCFGRKVTDKNSLKTWCLNSGDYGKQLLKEWTGQCLDDNKQYTPDEITKASGKKFRWQCSKDTSHIWDAVLVSRTGSKSGCPYCSGTKITDKNSLKNWCLNNGDFGKQLLKEWTGQCLDDNKQYTPDEVTKASKKRFKWQCSKDPSHIWDARVKNRTISKSGCPYCSRRRATNI